MSKSKTNDLSCVSLFSGCGGLDLGLRQAGFVIRFGTDLDRIAAKSHSFNFPDVPFVCGRIGALTAADVRAAASLKKGEQIDLLAGGPPCPPFSKSRFYRKDKPRSLEDPVAAETIGGYLRLLQDLRPRAFLLENVKGLAYDVHQDALKEISSQAHGLGYALSMAVLNAADYGVPQIRERCFVMGSLEGQVSFPLPSRSKDGADGLPRWGTAGEVLNDLDTEENASDVGHFAGGKHHDLLKLIPPGDNYLFLTEKRGHPEPRFKWRSRYWSFLLKLSPELPSWTIQARRSNNMGPLHWRNRILRIGEVRRLQTFPDDFFLAGTIEQQWRQLGNAVPPLLAHALGKVLIEHLCANRVHRRAA